MKTKVIGVPMAGGGVAAVVAWAWNGLFPEYPMTARSRRRDRDDDHRAACGVGRVVAAAGVILLAPLLAGCAVVIAPGATITVDDGDTIIVRDNEALTK